VLEGLPVGSGAGVRLIDPVTDDRFGVALGVGDPEELIASGVALGGALGVALDMLVEEAGGGLGVSLTSSLALI
jgi:hypothetical protein